MLFQISVQDSIDVSIGGYRKNDKRKLSIEIKIVIMLTTGCTSVLIVKMKIVRVKIK